MRISITSKNSKLVENSLDKSNDAYRRFDNMFGICIYKKLMIRIIIVTVVSF